MDDLERSLHRAAGLIADYRRDAADARVGPELDPRGRRIAPRSHAAGRANAHRHRDRRARRVGGSGPHGLGGAAVLRLRRRRLARRGARRRLLTSGWDQNAFNGALSPASLAFEDVAGAWLKQLLGLPASASVGFVTGAGGANTVGLAAGRSHVLAAHGWDADRDGLFGAPRLRVVASVERHATVDRSLRLLGLGDGSIDDGAGDGERRRWTPTRCPRALAAGPDGPDHRLRAGGQREHRRLRRPAGDRRRRPRARGMAPRGRRVRALGRREPAGPPRSSTGSSSPTRGDVTGTSG